MDSGFFVSESSETTSQEVQIIKNLMPCEWRRDQLADHVIREPASPEMTCVWVHRG